MEILSLKKRMPAKVETITIAMLLIVNKVALSNAFGIGLALFALFLVTY